MGKNPYTFPVCSSYKTTTNTSKVVLLASKSWENLETEASSTLQEMGRDKQEVNWGKLQSLGKGGVLGKTGRVLLSGAVGVTCGAHVPWARHSHLLGLRNRWDQSSVSKDSEQSRTWHHSNVFKHEWQLLGEKWGDMFGYRWGDVGKTQTRLM